MTKSIYLNFPSTSSTLKGGDLPYKFIVPLDETLKLNPKSEIALHNVEIERPLIVLNKSETHEFWININNTENAIDVYDYYQFPPIYDSYKKSLLTPNEVNSYETKQEQQITFQANPFYNKLIPNIKVVIPYGVYSKNQFLETLQDAANKAIATYFSNYLPQFYNPYKFAVVNDGSKVFIGLFNESKLLPVKISDVTAEVSAGIINSVGLVDTSVSDVVVADFVNPPNNLAYPVQQYLAADSEQRTFRLNTDKTIGLAAVAGNNWNTFAFMNSSVNILNNKQDLLTDRQNSGIQFSLGLAEGENEEYFVGFLSQAYQQTHWTNKAQPQTTIIEQINSAIPLAYCGTYFKKDSTTGNLYLHVVGTSNPYYAVDTFTNLADPPVAGRKLCYRNSVSPIEEMNVLYSTVLPEDLSVKSKSMFGIEFYYRYSTNSKNLIYRNYSEKIVANQFKPLDYQPENFRLYFRVYTTSSIDSKTNNRIIFDSRSIDYYFSHYMAIDNYNIVNPTSINSAVFLNGGFENVRDAAWNTGVACGMVPFIACKNVAVATGGFFNMNMNSTRLDDYQNAKEIGDDNLDELGYYKADPLTEITIASKYNYLPLGIFSYGFANVSQQLSTILGASPIAQTEKNNIPVSYQNQLPKFTFGGFNANRFPFDINAELGISQIYTEGNKYHIIIKNVPIAVMTNIKEKDAGGSNKSVAKRQNIIYTLRQSDINLTNVEANNLTITHYPNLLKYLSLYNNNEIQLNALEVEIRNAETGEYAEEITDCSLEILFNQN